MNIIQLLGPALGLAYLSGLNLYAAVLTIGLGTRFGLIELPDQLQGLSILSDPLILIVAGILFLIEFFADKIPWIDSIWDAIHTFIRPVGAAVLGVVALGDIDPVYLGVASLVLGGVGLSSHSSKAGVRLVANQSPEPFSNIVLSLVEDGVVIGGAWLATAHPVLSFWIVLVFLAVTMFFFPKMLRLVRMELSALGAIVKKALRFLRVLKNDNLIGALPDKYERLVPSNFQRTESDIHLLLFTGKGVRIDKKKVGRNYRGYLSVIDGNILILIDKRFKIREYHIVEDGFCGCEFKWGILLDSLNLHYTNTLERFQLPKGQSHLAEKVIAALSKGRTKKVGAL